MIPGDQPFIDPNQQEALKRRSACFDFMGENARRGSGIHVWDAQVLATLVSILYKSLPVHNTQPTEIGDKFEEDWYAYRRRIDDLATDKSLSPDEYAFRAWSETALFIERCTTFMNDTLFVRLEKRKKLPTEGVGYEPKR
jgi:hypothetical protein